MLLQYLLTADPQINSQILHSIVKHIQYTTSIFKKKSLNILPNVGDANIYAAHILSPIQQESKQA